MLQVLDSRQSWVIPLQGGFEIGYSGSQLMPVCIFASLPARYTTTVIEVVRPPCAGGMQWKRKACLASNCGSPDLSEGQLSVWCELLIGLFFLHHGLRYKTSFGGAVLMRPNRFQRRRPAETVSCGINPYFIMSCVIFPKKAESCAKVTTFDTSPTRLHHQSEAKGWAIRRLNSGASLPAISPGG